MSMRTHSTTKHDSGGRSARVTEPDRATAAGVPAAAGSLGAWARERGLPGDPAEDALAGRAGRARELPQELVEEALALARLRRDLGGGEELAREVRDRLQRTACRAIARSRGTSSASEIGFVR